MQFKPLRAEQRALQTQPFAVGDEQCRPPWKPVRPGDLLAVLFITSNSYLLGVDTVMAVRPIEVGGDIAIDFVNLSSFASPMGWLVRGTGKVTNIPNFTYSTGELTTAGVVEGGLFVYGIAKGVRAAAAVAEHVPFVSRGLIARETEGWGLGADNFTTLYHGTTPEGANAIRTQGIDLAKGNDASDFGQGFYLTGSKEEALSSAARKTDVGEEAFEVVVYKIANYQLDKLNKLEFDGPNEEWQSSVWNHKRPQDATRIQPHGGGAYGMVKGLLCASIQ